MKDASVDLAFRSTYAEITVYRDSGKIWISQVKWYLFPTPTGGESISIGDRALPVSHSGSVVTLGVNDDLGEYYEKVR